MASQCPYDKSKLLNKPYKALHDVTFANIISLILSIFFIHCALLRGFFFFQFLPHRAFFSSSTILQILFFLPETLLAFYCLCLDKFCTAFGTQLACHFPWEIFLRPLIRCTCAYSTLCFSIMALIRGTLNSTAFVITCNAHLPYQTVSFIHLNYLHLVTYAGLTQGMSHLMNKWIMISWVNEWMNQWNDGLS